MHKCCKQNALIIKQSGTHAIGLEYSFIFYLLMHVRDKDYSNYQHYVVKY